MVQKVVKVFPQETQLWDMQTVDGTSGYELSDIINSDQYETYVEETLYTSLNQIRFYYPITGIHFQYLKNGNHILYPTPTGYNLYTIDNLSITTDEEVLQVDAQHYSVNFMRDSAHELAIGRNAATISNINNTLTKSVYVSDEFNLVGSGTARGGYSLKDDSYNGSLASATVGSALVGSNSILRRYYGQYIRRNRDHIEAFEVNEYTGETQPYPIVLGINVRDMDYSIDTTGIYTTAVVSASSIPDIRIEGADSIGGRYSGIGGSIWPTLEDMDDDIMFSVVYKGLPLLFTKVGGVITVGLTKLVNSSGEQIDSIVNGVCSYTNGVFKVSRGGDTLIEEVIDPNYFYGIEVYKTNDNNPKTYQYLGKNTFNKEQGYKYTTVIPPHNVQYAVRAETEHKGNSVKYVDYEAVIIEEEEGKEVEGLSRFFYWHFNKFKDFWTEFENKKLLEPKFEARFTIDDMRTLYGQEVINNHIFRVGDLYEVDAQDYDLQFKAAITKTKYNGLTGEIIEIEFGNRQDIELEELKTTNTNKPDKRKDDVRSGSSGGGNSSGSSGVSRRTDTKPVITLRESKINYQGDGNLSVFEDNLISAYDKEDGDITHQVTIQSSETEATYSVTDSDGNTTTKTATIEYLGGGDGGFNEDELGSWLDITLNGDGDIRGDKDLFEGDLPYIKETDDTGIPRMEWRPPYVTISPDGSESTPTKLVCYNGSEAVIDEVKFKGEYGGVELYGHGGFKDRNGFLPDNRGFPIVPYPEGTRSLRTWAPVFDLHTNEAFNKDTEHGSFRLSEKDGSTQEDVALVKEELGYRYAYAVNATTRGTIKFETERVMSKRYLNELSKHIRGNVSFGMHGMYQVKDLDEFKREVIDRLQGQTLERESYKDGLENDLQSLAYYLKQVGEGEQPYLKTIYRHLLRDILYQLGDRGGHHRPGEVTTFGGVLTITVEFTGVTERHRRIVGVDFDEKVFEQQVIRDGPFIKEEPGWQRLIFTQPTTKVNDQVVKVNQLLITNGGVPAKEALIDKQSIDGAWELLSPAERKEFEDTYGKEWWFNLRYSPDHYDSDDVLYGAFYREKHKIKPPGALDIFGTQAMLIRKDQEIAKKVSERYQQKYNFLVAKEYVVPPSQNGQAIYDRVEKHYLEQAPIEA